MGSKYVYFAVSIPGSIGYQWLGGLDETFSEAFGLYFNDFHIPAVIII